MNEALVKRILQKFSFPQHDLTSIQVEPMLGGRQHNAFKLTLATGLHYVLKHLNFDCYFGHYTANHFNATEKFASYVNQNIQHSLAAITSDKDYVVDVNNASYMLYPWVDGDIFRKLSTAQAALLGTYLANIHGLSPIDISLDVIPPYSFKTAQWQKLVEMGLLEPVALSKFIQMAKQCEQDSKAYQGKYVLSHRDMNLDNILWLSKKDFVWLDWESSGFIAPVVDLIGLAINVGGIADGVLDLALVEATIRAYNNNKTDKLQINSMHYSQSYASWFLWLDYCRSTDHMIEKLRASEIKITIKAIELLQREQKFFLDIS